MKERQSLVAARKAKGFSQEELAAKCDVTRWTINRIELGERNPSYALIAKMKEVLAPLITEADFFDQGAAAPHNEGAAA